MIRNTVQKCNVLVLVLAAAAAGCASKLEPAPTANTVPGPGEAATAEEGDIRVTAAADAWRSIPLDLDATVTPMLVAITNDGPHMIEVRYEHFNLVSPSGARFAALPPFRIDGAQVEPGVPEYPPTGFSVAPYLSPWYPGWTATTEPFPRPDTYYNTYYPGFGGQALPTLDMLQRALPEGLLGPAGRLTGFLYFQKVEGVERATFVARIVEANTANVLRTIEIPFVVDD